MNTLFSVIIPCYNQAHFLPDCLDSLLEQSYSNWEAIVVNDGSTDNTNKITLAYVAKDSRIKLAEKQNGGLSSTRNYGLTFAKGSRLIFLDADDFLYPNCLEQIALVANNADDMDLIQYGYSYITEDKQRILGHVGAIKKKSLIPEIFKGNLGPCHSICISRSLMDAIGLFDESLKSVEDWDLWMRAIKAGGKQKLLQETLVYYRYSKNSMSRNPFVMYDALKTVIRRGPRKDDRILISSPFNKNYEFDTAPVLQGVLLRSLGVGVMQGKGIETLDFFKKETVKSLDKYTPKDFELMCSYLSFRYWYSSSDIEEVLNIIYPRFVRFFQDAGYTKSFTKRALYLIFKRHFYYKNLYRYGKFMGKLFNFVLRNYNEIRLLRIS